jgi:uncharacterized membrane protein YuzA (DUF378 family)
MRALSVGVFNVNLIAMLIVGVTMMAVFVYIPTVSGVAFCFMLAAYLVLFHHKK